MHTYMYVEHKARTITTCRRSSHKTKQRCLVVTHVAALGDADAAAQAAGHLADVHHARDAHHLQHAVVVRRLGELVVAVRTPHVGTRAPAAAQTRKRSVNLTYTHVV